MLEDGQERVNGSLLRLSQSALLFYLVSEAPLEAWGTQAGMQAAPRIWTCQESGTKKSTASTVTVTVSVVAADWAHMCQLQQGKGC
mmetsp:Transcript_16152/g.41901  ORF Transcript_16152/g.41901 Transcript_16152/m.41901 type:complete len:86 (+) Transcript_16152:4570-4827(+)